jgi:hypothetical protein
MATGAREARRAGDPAGEDAGERAAGVDFSAGGDAGDRGQQEQRDQRRQPDLLDARRSPLKVASMSHGP